MARGVIINPIVVDLPSIFRKDPHSTKNAFSISSGILKGLLEMFQNNRRINYGIQSFQWFPGNGLIDKNQNVCSRTDNSI